MHPYVEKRVNERLSKMTTEQLMQECQEKAKILEWLIMGAGIHCLPMSAVSFLTKERIVELYNVELFYFFPKP